MVAALTAAARSTNTKVPVGHQLVANLDDAGLRDYAKEALAEAHLQMHSLSIRAQARRPTVCQCTSKETPKLPCGTQAATSRLPVRAGHASDFGRAACEPGRPGHWHWHCQWHAPGGPAAAALAPSSGPAPACCTAARAVRGSGCPGFRALRPAWRPGQVRSKFLGRTPLAGQGHWRPWEPQGSLFYPRGNVRVRESAEPSHARILG